MISITFFAFLDTDIVLKRSKYSTNIKVIRSLWKRGAHRPPVQSAYYFSEVPILASSLLSLC